MNNFEAKYIQISSKYLSDKLESLNVHKKREVKEEVKEESKIHKIVTSFFK